MSDWPYEPSEAVSRRRRREAAARRKRQRTIALTIVVVALVAAAAAVLTSGVLVGGGRRAAKATSGSSIRSSTSARLAPAAQRPDPGTVAIDRVLQRRSYILSGGPKRQVALTFDDGPGPYTPDVLRILQREQVPATFFQIGRMIPVFPKQGRAVLAAHFAIGNHTQNHPLLAGLGPGLQTSELERQLAAMSANGEPRPRLFRPPYRSFNSTTLAIARRLRMLTVLWSVDSQDYRRPGVSVIVERVLSGVRPGAIVLMHDGGGPRLETVEALPQIIRALRARHYRFVTVPEMLATNPPGSGTASRAASRSSASAAAAAGSPLPAPAP